MACRIIPPEQVRLYIDDVRIPLAVDPINQGDNYQHFYPEDSNFRLPVNRLTGRIFKAEVSVPFQMYLNFPHPWKFDAFGGSYTQGYTTNPALITAPPWSVDTSCANCCSFAAYSDAAHNCNLKVEFGLQWSVLCTASCTYEYARVPSSRILSVTDIDNKVYSIQNYNYIGCSRTDVAANNNTAAAIKAAISTEGGNCVPSGLEVTVKGTSLSLNNCGFIEVFNSPVKLKSVLMGNNVNYPFETGAC